MFKAHLPFDLLPGRAGAVAAIVLNVSTLLGTQRLLHWWTLPRWYWNKVSWRMRQIPILEVSSRDESSLEEELIAIPTKKKTLKSGKLRTADSLILHRIVWLHEMVYMAAEQPAVYDNISIPLFISGYMQVIEA